MRLRYDVFIYTESAPLVVVFTKYDRLVRVKKAELREDHDDARGEELDKLSREEARKALESYVNSTSVKEVMNGIRYLNVSSMLSHSFFGQC
jgi:hypothetical protein